LTHKVSETTDGIAKLEALEEGRKKWDRVHSLVERAGVEMRDRDNLLRQCRRTAEDVGRLFSASGFGTLADAATQLAQLVGRTRNFEQRRGVIRESVAAVHNAIDRTERAINADAQKESSGK
jgi:hypothetical protein